MSGEQGTVLGVHLGLREQVRAQVGELVREFLALACSDQLTHAELIAQGRFDFRQHFLREILPMFQGNAGMADPLADVCYQFLVGVWRTKYPGLSPAQFLNRVRIVSPPTVTEIEDAWELEIGSSDRALRQHYDGSARTRRGADIFRGQKGGR